MKKALLPLLALLITAACGAKNMVGEQVANRLASPAWMVKRQIPAAPFALTAFERMHQRHGYANIYIEGEGFDITPKQDEYSDGVYTALNPVALHMAAMDKSENVAYLTRPCQHSGMLSTPGECDKDYLDRARFSQTVIDSYNTALDEISARYDIKGFHLIGHAGGGAIATILAGTRGDILSLRTVAGNLDTRTYAAHHGRSLLDRSINPLDYAAKLKNFPQAHYIGGQDKNIPPAILHSYLQAAGQTNCITHELIQEAEHRDGWAKQWPNLLARKVECVKPVSQPAVNPYKDYRKPAPIYYPREPGLEKGKG